MIYTRAIRSVTNNVGSTGKNRSVCRHAQTAGRCRTRRVHSLVHTAAPSRRVPFAPTENTSEVVSVYRTNPTQWMQCVHGESDAYRSRTVRASGTNCSVNMAEHMFYLPRPHGDARLDIDIPIMPQLWMLGAFSLHPETGLAFNEHPVRVS